MASASSPSPKLEDAVLWEIRYQATRFRGEWVKLLELLAPHAPETLHEETKRVLQMWSLIDAMLTRVTRIDRMLNPMAGRAPDSLAAREDAAAHLRSHLPTGTFEGTDVKQARNIMEHSDEYLPRFLETLKGHEPTQFTIGPDPRTTPRPDGKIAFRSYDPFTSDLVVFGQGANLRKVSDDVRALLMHLPNSPTRVGRTMVPIPEPQLGGDER
jgi:hypothetical protein